MDLKRHKFPAPVGPRWLGSCDVPDLALLPMQYNSTRTVTFHAGFASDLGHLFVWAMAGLVKAGLISNMTSLSRPLNQLSQWLEPLVNDKRAMFVELEGTAQNGSNAKKCWSILASQNHGPYIPCGAAIALADKLANGAQIASGARPCMGLLTIDEYLQPLQNLNLQVVADKV